MLNSENLHGHINGSQGLHGSGMVTKGDSAFLHIKYSINQPTSDSDLIDEINNWIGIYCNNISEDSEHYTDYQWYKIVGNSGPQGEIGPRGISITGIEKISTAGTIDTYRISFSDDTYFDYTVTNGGEANIIEKVLVNGVEIPIVNKSVDITVPTNLSDLNNDSGFITGITFSDIVISVSSKITANTNYTIPVSYIVGANEIEIFWNGIYLAKDENWEEVGAEGQTSTTVKFGWDIEVGEELLIRKRGVSND